MTVARLQHYVLLLAGFKVQLSVQEHHSTWKDGLSRLPLKKECNKEVADPVEIFQVSQLEVLPVSANMIRQAT